MKGPQGCLRLVALAVAFFVAGGAYWYIGNRLAERHAQTFCDAIPLRANIATTLERAKKENISYIFRGWYVFHFSGAFFDTAVCEVETDDQGIVKGKSVTLYVD